MLRFTFIVIGFLLANLPTFTAKATLITRVLYEPEISFSANGLHRFTLIDACENIEYINEHLKYIYIEFKSDISENHQECQNSSHIFIGEFSDLGENGNWHVVWKKVFTDGSPAYEWPDKWIIDDDGQIIVGSWYENEENIISVDREGNFKKFSLMKSLINSKLISSEYEYNFINWQKKYLWNRVYVISNDKKSIIIDMIPAECNILFGKIEKLVLNFSLETGKFTVNLPNDWQSMRRTINCDLIPKEMERLINLPGSIVHENGSVTWNPKLEGFYLLFYKIKAKIKYEITYMKSVLSQFTGNSCF